MGWRQYSAALHAGYEGYIEEIPIGAYFGNDLLPLEDRARMDGFMYQAFLTRHIGRAATVLLALVTELQAHFRFGGANINKRIVSMWEALQGIFEADEIYKERYAALLQERGMLVRD